MSAVNDLFGQGPAVVNNAFQSGTDVQSWPEMDVKELADISWTRANSLVRANVALARQWALAALAGYDYLARRGSPMAARSAEENASALRTWSLLKEVPAA